MESNVEVSANWFPQPKIPRWSREVIITEKIDGTNAAIIIEEDGRVIAASKNRLLTWEFPDNHGFRAWVQQNAVELRTLGVGCHRGEWWGAGINKRHPTHSHTFSLFNVHRWHKLNPGYEKGEIQLLPTSVEAPACCSVVPILARSEMGVTDQDLNWSLSWLRENGSLADPNCKNPEGIVIYHVASGQLFKKTLENDGVAKGAVK